MSDPKDVLYYDEGCRSCTKDYFLEVVGVFYPSIYGVGVEHLFDSDGHELGISKDYAIRAIIQPGNDVLYIRRLYSIYVHLIRDDES